MDGDASGAVEAEEAACADAEICNPNKLVVHIRWNRKRIDPCIYIRRYMINVWQLRSTRPRKIAWQKKSNSRAILSHNCPTSIGLHSEETAVRSSITARLK